MLSLTWILRPLRDRVLLTSLRRRCHWVGARLAGSHFARRKGLAWRYFCYSLAMRVLISEDDTLLADGLRRVLETAMFAVDVVRTGESADKLLRAADQMMALFAGISEGKAIRLRLLTQPLCRLRRSCAP